MMAAGVWTAQQARALPAVVKLSDLSGANGFALNGVSLANQTGHSVSGAGDINGDGIDDIIVGSYFI